MAPRHPFQTWPTRHRRPLLLATVVLALLPGALLALVTPLHEDRPGGADIVDFELAGSVARVVEILATWRVEGVIGTAKAIQLLDLVYPLIYAAALAGVCIACAGWWSRRERHAPATAGVVLAWVAFAAAGFDYAENLGLAVSLWGTPAAPWPQVALAAAVLKFAAIGACGVYALSVPIAFGWAQLGSNQ